jgi:hypothetical protein
MSLSRRSSFLQQRARSSCSTLKKLVNLRCGKRRMIKPKCAAIDSVRWWGSIPIHSLTQFRRDKGRFHHSIHPLKAEDTSGRNTTASDLKQEICRS